MVEITMRSLLCIFTWLVLTANIYAADFTLTSSAFRQNGAIPNLYTCKGKNMPPPLSWTDPPANTQSFALIVSTPDSALGGVTYDYVLYNIPSQTKSLPQDIDKLPEGTLIGKTSSGDSIYYGPCPPDKLVHHHVFTLYALDAKLDLLSDAEPEEVLKKIKKHLIKQTQLIGIFKY